MANTQSESVLVKPIAGKIGAEIHGADLSKPLSDTAIAEIRQALLKWKVVFFRNQNIGHAEQVAFTGRFGEVTYAHPLEDEPNSSHPEILAIDRRRYERKDGRRYTYESRWHTDVTAVVNPPAGSILRAVTVPEVGGDTTWTNLVAAYEGLSEPLRELADKLKAEHRFNARQRFRETDNPYLRRAAANPQVSIHPVVRVHPETGERALFVSPGFTSHLIGLSQRESDKLLELFFEQIARPAYTVRFRWTPGDVAFWDNRATAHLGPQDLDDYDVERVLYRTTIVGDVPVGVDGFRSQLIQGQPFGVETSPVAKKPEHAPVTAQA
jgi:alpha-ketoglutarate-dependent sulfate ester dioxygenase